MIRRGNASEATSPTRNDGRRSSPSPGRSAFSRARLIMAGSRSRPVTSRPCSRASRIDRRPGPQPTSSTRAPSGATAATSAAMRRKSEPSTSRWLSASYTTALPMRIPPGTLRPVVAPRPCRTTATAAAAAPARITNIRDRPTTAFPWIRGQSWSCGASFLAATTSLPL